MKMSTLIVLIVQSKTEATLIILSLLLIAGIIGYVTAWLYSKSLFRERISTFESKVEELKRSNVNLTTENRNLHDIIREKDRDIERLNKEVNSLKVLNSSSLKAAADLNQKNSKTEHELHEKDEALLRISQRKHMLDYNSFGSATPAEKDDLQMISGIGPFIEKRLHAVDIYSFKQISKFTKKDIEKINVAIEYFAGRIERDEWVEQAKELVADDTKRQELLERIRVNKSRIFYQRIGIATKTDADDLTVISGIGGWISQKLNALDIYTYKQISNFTEEDSNMVTEAIEYFPGRIERDEWAVQARELVKIAGKKTEMLTRVREIGGRIYRDKFGVSHKLHANNLTLIKGVSLWIEERLNMIDLYTFDQISRLTPEDVKLITEIFEIAPERIERDNWIGQAKELARVKSNPAFQ
jgi:predicted flap endonuclease-1-like 5' DNA nuclease